MLSMKFIHLHENNFVIVRDGIYTLQYERMLKVCNILHESNKKYVCMSREVCMCIYIYMCVGRIDPSLLLKEKHIGAKQC